MDDRAAGPQCEWTYSNAFTTLGSTFPLAWEKMIRLMSGLPILGARSSNSMTSPGRNGLRYMAVAVVTMFRFLPSPLSYHSWSAFKRLMEPVDMFFILTVVTISLPTTFAGPCTIWIVATPLIGGTHFAGAAGAGVVGAAATALAGRAACLA